MRSIRNFILMAFAVTSLLFASVTAQSPYTTDQKSIETKVFKEIIRLPYYGIFDDIGYKVDGGTVTLTGKVISLGTRQSAERVVKRIPGVIAVVNNIEELPQSSFDNNIRRNLLREFVNAPVVYTYLRGPNPSVRLIVDRGRITLEGYVSDKGTSNLMYVLANQVPGTFGVTNNLVVSKGDA